MALFAGLERFLEQGIKGGSRQTVPCDLKEGPGQGFPGCGPQGRVLADVIIPYPRLGEMFGTVCDGLGVQRPLPRENVSKKREAGPIPETLQRELRAFYAEDYALWERLDTINAAGMAWLRTRLPGAPRPL